VYVTLAGTSSTTTVVNVNLASFMAASAALKVDVMGPITASPAWGEMTGPAGRPYRDILVLTACEPRRTEAAMMALLGCARTTKVPRAYAPLEALTVSVTASLVALRVR